MRRIASAAVLAAALVFAVLASPASAATTNASRPTAASAQQAGLTHVAGVQKGQDYRHCRAHCGPWHYQWSHHRLYRWRTCCMYCQRWDRDQRHRPMMRHCWRQRVLVR